MSKAASVTLCRGVCKRLFLVPTETLRDPSGAARKLHLSTHDDSRPLQTHAIELGSKLAISSGKTNAEQVTSRPRNFANPRTELSIPKPPTRASR